MRPLLSRERPDTHTPDPGDSSGTGSTSPSGRPAAGGRRPRRARGQLLPGLLAGLLATLGLAATPGSDLGAAVTESVERSVSATVAGTVAGAARVVGADAADTTGGDDAPPAERAVRTVTVGAPTLAEQATYQQVAASPPGEEDDAEGTDTATEADDTATEADDGQPAGEAARGVWDRLADCESGDWDEHGEPRPGTARWDYGLGFAHDGYEQFQGGLNFHPGTWDAFRDPGMADHAGHASRAQQIAVGERVLAAQGWSAWPVCSRMLGLR